METLSAENFCLQKSKFKNRFMQAGLASISYLFSKFVVYFFNDHLFPNWKQSDLVCKETSTFQRVTLKTLSLSETSL